MFDKIISLRVIIHTQTSFIIMSNKGKLPASGQGHIIAIITILRIVVCLQRRHKGTIKGFGSSVCCNRGWKKEQFRDPTVSGFTTKAPLSIPGGRIMTRSGRWQLWNGFAGKGCSKFAENLCTWCALRRHKYIEQNAPCVRQMPAALIFEEDHLHDKNKVHNEHNAHN